MSESANAEQTQPGSGAGNDGTTGRGDGDGAKPKRTFGGLTPQEAGRKSAEARKRRDLAQAESLRAASDGRIVFVRVPVHLGDIVAALAKGAARGDAGQARELRSWMAEYPVDDDTDISALDRRTRQALKARLLAELDPTPQRPIVSSATAHEDDGASGQ